MPEIILTIHRGEGVGPISVNVQVPDEKEAAKLLRGQGLVDLGVRLAKALG